MSSDSPTDFPLFVTDKGIDPSKGGQDLTMTDLGQWVDIVSIEKLDGVGPVYKTLYHLAPPLCTKR